LYTDGHLSKDDDDDDDDDDDIDDASMQSSAAAESSRCHSTCSRQHTLNSHTVVYQNKQNQQWP